MSAYQQPEADKSEDTKMGDASSPPSDQLPAGNATAEKPSTASVGQQTDSPARVKSTKDSQDAPRLTGPLKYSKTLTSLRLRMISPSVQEKEISASAG